MIDKATAEGMRQGILAQREREGLTGPNPYGSLDFDREADRKIIASVYAAMARPAIHVPLVRCDSPLHDGSCNP